MRWTYVFNGTGSFFGYDIDQFSDNSTIIIGERDNHIFVIRVDKDGELTYQFVIYSVNILVGTAYSVVVNIDDSFVIAGRIQTYHDPSSVVLIKCSQDGDVIWAKELTSKNPSFSYSGVHSVGIVRISNNGAFAVTGGYKQAGYPVSALIAIFDDEGNMDKNELGNYKLNTITNNLTVLSFVANTVFDPKVRWTNAIFYRQNITSSVRRSDPIHMCYSFPLMIFILFLILLSSSCCLLALAFSFCRKKPLHETYVELSKTSESSGLRIVGYFSPQISNNFPAKSEDLAPNDTASYLINMEK
ncbi:MAG: hypothetical protein LRY69_01260 [Gammaproteobacteria bacterium]|nr:hypothetical protein [Gammaproteobacteria bacterium]